MITRVPSNGNPGIVPPWLQHPPKAPIPFVPPGDIPRILPIPVKDNA